MPQSISKPLTWSYRVVTDGPQLFAQMQGCSFPVRCGILTSDMTVA